MLNEVRLIGNLGQDPDTRFTTNGTAVTNLSVATSSRWKNKQSGEWEERTEWHAIVLFGQPAEFAGEFLKKGARVYVEGELRTESWEDRETGEKRSRVKVYGRRILSLDRKSDGEERPPARRPQQPAQGQLEALSDFDDDIPF